MLLHRKPSPLRRAAQRRKWYHTIYPRLIQGASEGEPYGVLSGRHPVAEPDYRGRHQRIAELHLVRIEPMNVAERHGVEQVALYDRAVVHVHEFAWDQPAGERVLRHPWVTQHHEVAVQPGKAVDLQAPCLPRLRLEPLLLRVRDMVMPDVRRVAYQQIEPLRILRRIDPRKVVQADFQTARVPESRRRRSVVPVDFIADRSFDTAAREHGAQRRIERTGADSRIDESHGSRFADTLVRIAEQVRCQRRWRGELPHPVPLRLVLPGVQLPLQRQPARFPVHDPISHLQAKLRKIVDPMFPDPSRVKGQRR